MMKKLLVLGIFLLFRFCEGGTLFVSLGNGQIAVVDTQTKKVVHTINSITGQAGLTISPNGQRLFALSASLDRVATFNTETFGYIFDGSGVGPGLKAGYSPDNLTLYVPLPGFGSHTLGVLTNTVTSTIQVTGTPVSSVVHPTADMAYVVHSNVAFLSFIDTATQLETLAVPLANIALNIAINDSGSQLAVPINSTGEVELINSSSGSLQHSVTVGSAPYDVAYGNNGYVYVTNFASDTVSAINTSTGSVEHTYSVGDGPTFLTYDSIENKIYVSNTTDGTISVLNGMPGASVEAPIEQVGTSPAGIAYMSTNTFMVFGNRY